MSKKHSVINRTTRRVGCGVALLLFSAFAAHACIFTYTLVGPGGETELAGSAVPPALPSAATPVVQVGKVYRIEITMRENHANCRIDPQDTLFLLEEGRWRVLRETQPLVLLAEIEWEQVANRRYTTAIDFRPAEPGLWRIDVIRECDRGGYHEVLLIEAQQGSS